MSAQIRQHTTTLQALVNEVKEWRTEQDSGSAEWQTLCALADEVESLLLALPWELQPVPTVDELIKEIGL
ncbi:hypothetical protein [Streptomyces sp. NPDC055709]